LDFNEGGLPKSTANFLEPGGNDCELRVTSCEVKNFCFVFVPRFFKVLPRLPATRNPQQALVIFRRWILGYYSVPQVLMIIASKAERSIRLSRKMYSSREPFPAPTGPNPPNTGTFSGLQQISEEILR
jgi:hypothetical protein